MNQYAIKEESTLGLEISTSRGSLRITFRPLDDRAFVVGSSPHADLRLSGQRVGGVAFHLERRGGGVELFPADTTRDVFVNGTRVTAPLLLPDSCVVDLPGERLVLSTFDATGLLEASSVRLAEAGIAYVAALPSENDTTRIGIEAGPDSDAIYEMTTTAFVPPHVHEMRTVAFEPAKDPHLSQTVSFDGRRTDKLPVHQLSRTMPLGPTGTDVIRASDLQPPQQPPVQVITDKITRAELFAPPPVAGPPIMPAAIITPPSATVAPESRGPATTRFDLPEPGAANVAPGAAANIGTDTTQFDVRRAGTGPAPVEPQRSSPPPSTWASDNPTVVSAAPRGQRMRIALRRLGQSLQRAGRRSPGEHVVALGLLARKRPLAVSVGAVAIACAFALALSGAAKLAGFGKHPPRPVAAATAKPRQAPALPAPTTPTVVPSMVVRPAPPPPAASASARPRPRGIVVDADVATASADLAAGRDAQARTAYTRLAARSPENPAYESLATLLARAASPECQNDKGGARTLCPEVKR